MNWRNILKEFYKNTFHLHHWTMTSKSLDYWDNLRQSQWDDMKKIKEIQLEKLRKLLIHTYANVPYYRKIFNEHLIKPKQIQDFDDLLKIPFLEKEVVKHNVETSLLSKKCDVTKVLKIRTSGSTGMPMHIYADIKQLDMRYAAVMRSWEWTDWDFGDKSLRLWHQNIGMTEEQVAKEWLDSFLMNRNYLPVFEMNDANLMKYISIIKDYKPKIMDGYAEAFDILAQFIKANYIEDVFVPSIISSAQMLTDKMRTEIANSMHTEVFDRYGCRELSTIAHECKIHKGYHVNAENLIVEIITDGRLSKENEIGEVIITDLNNYSLPLIRYRLGDLAQRINETCSCGRGLPLIGKIYGRTKGVIIGTNGRYLTTSFFLHYLKDYDNEIRQFQIIQDNYGSIIIRIIPENAKKGISKKSLASIKKDFKKYLGLNMEINFQITDKIEMIKTGKYIPVISMLNIDFQNINDHYSKK